MQEFLPRYVYTLMRLVIIGIGLGLALSRSSWQGSLLVLAATVIVIGCFLTVLIAMKILQRR